AAASSISTTSIPNSACCMSVCRPGFPLTLQVYVNGHEWLARALDQQKLGYRRLDNAFLQLDHPGKAQALVDKLLRKKWSRFLDVLAKRVNPLLADLLKGCSYRWYLDQAE